MLKLPSSFLFFFFPSFLGLDNLLHGLDDGGGADAELVDKDLGEKNKAKHCIILFSPQNCSQKIVFLCRSTENYYNAKKVTSQIVQEYFKVCWR